MVDPQQQKTPSILDVVREGFTQTLGKIAVTREAAEGAVSRTVNRLVELGKLTQDEARNFTNEVKGLIEKNRAELEKRVDESVSNAMSSVRFPKREELETLRERVVQLEKLIDELVAQKAARH
jgi:polyhydroxyalkanoate synthesis regulator phasin